MGKDEINTIKCAHDPKEVIRYLGVRLTNKGTNLDFLRRVHQEKAPFCMVKLKTTLYDCSVAMPTEMLSSSSLGEKISGCMQR